MTQFHEGQQNTMDQFHEGQDVEVFKIITPPAYGRWRKGRITGWAGRSVNSNGHDHYDVEFVDGTHGVIDITHIRELK